MATSIDLADTPLGAPNNEETRTGIRVLINAISTRTGGAETFLRNLLRHLASCRPVLEFVLLVRESRAKHYLDLPDNVELLPVADDQITTRFQRLTFEHLRIPRLVRIKGANVHFQVDEMLSPLIILQGIPSLAVFHTSPVVLNQNMTGDGYLYQMFTRLIRWLALRFATAPVTVSFHGKAELCGGLPQVWQRMSVVPHGVDHLRFTPGQPQTDPPLPTKRPYLLSVSNRFAWKNYYRLLQAYQHLVDKDNISFDLVLVGQPKLPAEEERLTWFIQHHELTARVHIVNYVNHHKLPDLYRDSLAYVYPSLAETFGMTVLEAMACGTPVLCARWGVLPEVAGDAAHYFDPLDVSDMVRAVRAVTTDPQLRADLSEKGVAHAHMYTWEKAAKEYHRILWRVAEAKPPLFRPRL